ncbi:DUF4365 domain-containing protein [Shimia sp. MMG029]|uniref:DUF4365 domain-containing protein n=1 Tax=Shimia sp. MMG029 TaxID=3021978 RepID=UPI003F90CF1F
MIAPMLSKVDQKEQFSLTYLYAIASSVGFAVEQPRIDRNSIDACVRAQGRLHPQLDLQLKATSSPDIKPDGLHFRLKRKNYDDLRCERLVPAILAVYEMPTKEPDWFTFKDTESILRSRMWWVSLAGLPDIDKESKTVVLPRGQFLTPTTLSNLLEEISKGRLPCELSSVTNLCLAQLTPWPCVRTPCRRAGSSLKST